MIPVSGKAGSSVLRKGCAHPKGPRGVFLIESRGLVAVVLIDLVICGALSVQLGDTQVKYSDIDHVKRLAAGS